jgi:hypothetical protein
MAELQINAPVLMHRAKTSKREGLIFCAFNISIAY